MACLCCKRSGRAPATELVEQDVVAKALLVVQCRKVDAQCPFLHSLDVIWQFDREGIMPHRTTVFKDRPNERKINLK